MSKFNQRFFSRLDAAAETTGIPALARHEMRRRHLRWMPILALAIAVGGWAWGLARPDKAYLGYAAISVGFAIAVFLPIFGPIKPWGGAKLADEFDRQLRQRAFLCGFATVTFAAFLGIWLLLGLALIDNWNREALITQIAYFDYLLFVLYLAVPTLQASWATRPVEED
ncbi:hypothetical protein [Sphingomonas sp. KR3-1]|uniref:hypothetical protein n=1 Tax=Sphingomonas sp. KR3-1 TaxID=3156611 RepID=UPI0032B59DE5